MPADPDRLVRVGIAGVAAGAALFTIAVFAVGQADLVIRNVSPSVALGWYVRTPGPPRLGSLVTFPLPDEMGPYAASVPAMRAFFASHPLIKPVAAMAGDTICRDSDGVFSINGRALARAPRTGPSGHPLPVWQGCHTLKFDEMAVFTGRVADAIDSRLFGAVPLSEIQGVYTALWTEEGG